MKRYKALIHYEMKNLLFPLAYFLVIDGFFLWQIIQAYDKNKQFYLIYG